jgi:anti-sigma B factor antagonist
MIQISVERRGDWYVIGIRGRADGNTADQLETTLLEAVQQNTRVAADFSSLEYISSAGLRSLLQAARAAEAGRTEFAICRLTAPVARVFNISGLRQILTVVEELPC